MIQIDFLCTDANIFFYLTLIHTPPFLLRRALKVSFFFSYLNFNSSVVKIMFCYKIFFCVFIDSRNASIITFSRIFQISSKNFIFIRNFLWGVFFFLFAISISSQTSLTVENLYTSWSFWVVTSNSTLPPVEIYLVIEVFFTFAWEVSVSNNVRP